MTNRSGWPSLSIIADGHAVPVAAGIRDAGGGRGVREGAVPLIAEEAVTTRGAFGSGGKGPPWTR